jgi:signal transduction histidine kinase
MTETQTSEKPLWPRTKAASLRAFHAYASWLVGIGWWRFFFLSILLMIASGIARQLPVFNWTVRTEVLEPKPRASTPRSPASSAKGPVRYEVTIDDSGVRIEPRAPAASVASAEAAASAASGPAAAASPGLPDDLPSVHIKLPKSADTQEIKEAVEEARIAIEEAIAEEHRSEYEPRIVTTELGEYLPQMAFLFIIASIVIKITYKGRLQAEVKAAEATEVAEGESLKRQVVEARMAAMQAQVEPHFLFNTLASIDHLIETDPARASVMQKNLIALLRASMPTMREATTNGSRDLAAELAVIAPYLEILKVRMEDRLQTEIDVPAGLRSAEFPPLMLQSLVENAIKHGLEPKPEGGRLTVRAEVQHGALAVSVADTGLGFGKASTAGTGIGLANIRERLQLLHGKRGALVVTENPGGGTVATITVPYVARSDGAGRAAGTA